MSTRLASSEAFSTENGKDKPGDEGKRDLQKERKTTKQSQERGEKN